MREWIPLAAVMLSAARAPSEACENANFRQGLAGFGSATGVLLAPTSAFLGRELSTNDFHVIVHRT
jgi:hypothetical protein